MEIFTLFSLFILGISYGSTACVLSCMPFLAPLLVPNSKDLKSASKVVLAFSLGRVFTYILISIASSSSAVLVKKAINEESYFQIALGLSTIFMSFYLFYKIFYEQKHSCYSFSLASKLKSKSILGYFTIGALLSLNPCVPILTLISFSANAKNYVEASLYGLFFGLGGVVVMYVFYTLIFSNILRGLIEPFKKYKKQIEIFSAFTLLITGILVIFMKK